MPSQHSAHDSIRRFLLDCGVTAQLRETPIDHFAEVEAPEAVDPGPIANATSPIGDTAGSFSPHTPPADWGEPASPAPAQASAQEVMAAREAAKTARSLDELHAALEAFDGCPLKVSAKRTCPGEGPVGAALMFVGEAPGRDEDAAGRPFVGRSGQLLEKMLSAIGLRREEVYISNVVPWRPPGNRTPSPIETATCEVFVRREIDLVAPKILVPLGGPAAKTLLSTTAGIMRQRGRWVRYQPAEGGTHSCHALAMFHPAYLLRTPNEKQKAWRDLLALRGRLESEFGFDPLR